MKRTLSADTNSQRNKNLMVECPKCFKRMRSDTLKRHLPAHNSKHPCNSCKKLFRSDKLARHEILCHSHIDESLCNRYSGVHEQMDNDEHCSSVSGYFRSFDLNVAKSSDYDQILADSCTAAKEKDYPDFYGHIPLKHSWSSPFHSTNMFTEKRNDLKKCSGQFVNPCY